MSATITHEQARATILRVLTGIAPEIEPEAVDGALDLRDQCDIDSMDFLNLVIGVHQALGVDIPERDYPKLVTLDGFASYVAARSASHHHAE
ncbi:MAG: phosphopantetheine-binding protein [Chloroflexi bacterium]|nr:MAG: phosphopantetheine-binding protein [Chloroflexota bacterium]